MRSLRDLGLEAEKIGKKASTIQLSTIGNSPVVGTNWSQQEIDRFANEYHLWYAECLAILPNDLKDQFRTAYEGHGGPACIKRFIESPLEKIEIPVGNGYLGVRKLHIRWKYPYDSNFRKPFLNQKRIITEAMARETHAAFPVYEKGEQKEMPEVKALFLAANPRGTPRLAIDEEMHAIEQKLRASEYRDALVFQSAWAVRPDNLLQLLNQHQPHIVHFSGHGKGLGLSLVGNDGEERLVATRALQYLFTTLKDNIRLVLLNACYSREQAQALAQIIDCVVGMNDSIGDETAIAFASSFYRAIGFGRSIQEAFDQGITSLLLEGIPEEDIPELLVKDGVDPRQIVLIGGNRANL